MKLTRAVPVQWLLIGYRSSTDGDPRGFSAFLVWHSTALRADAPLVTKDAAIRSTKLVPTIW